VGKMAESKMFSTRIDADLIKQIKHLAVDYEKPIASLVEEAVRDLLKKYKTAKK
jgi:predicted transcriptional regulator